MNIKKTEKKNICIGKILSPHGIRGLVKLSLYTDHPHKILTHGKIFNKNGSQEFEIEIKSQNQDVFLASIKGIENRTQAEALKGVFLYIDRKDLPEPEDEDFYINDLLHLDVIDENKEILGTVVNFYNFGAGDVLEIKLKTTGELKCYSFTKNHFPEIDIKNGFIILSKS